MKWTENGIVLEGTPAEYLELRKTTQTPVAEGAIVAVSAGDLAKKTHRGKQVKLHTPDGEVRIYKSIAAVSDALALSAGIKVSRQKISESLLKNGRIELGEWAVTECDARTPLGF